MYDGRTGIKIATIGTCTHEKEVGIGNDVSSFFSGVTGKLYMDDYTFVDTTFEDIVTRRLHVLESLATFSTETHQYVADACVCIQRWTRRRLAHTHHIRRRVYMKRWRVHYAQDVATKRVNAAICIQYRYRRFYRSCTPTRVVRLIRGMHTLESNETRRVLNEETTLCDLCRRLVKNVTVMLERATRPTPLH